MSDVLIKIKRVPANDPYEILIWVRSWEDTFSATNMSVEQCHEFLNRRVEGTGINLEPFFCHSAT